jgi:hypothetical protein
MNYFNIIVSQISLYLYYIYILLHKKLGHNYNIPVILHLLDVFLTIQTADTSGDRTMAILTMIFKKLNIPLSTFVEEDY